MKVMLGTALTALLLVSATKQTGRAQPSTRVAVVSAAPAAQSGLAEGAAALATRVVWYTDPIALGLAVIALFAAIDIAILFAHNAHHSNGRHALR
ncbi:MAG TPA: hypothetical protein VH762_02700 [Gemmatimonadaceae bacterium]|jgi:hypothetical protein